MWLGQLLILLYNLQIIANTEVWDLRTFHLLQTVPVLDQRNCTFSPMHVIYGASLGADRDHDMETTTYDTSFNVLDAYDYSSIATIDVKRNINDLSVSANGSLIAVVEDHSGYDSKQETYVKIYAVGVKKSERSEEVRAVKDLAIDEGVARGVPQASSSDEQLPPPPLNAPNGDSVLIRIVEAVRPHTPEPNVALLDADADANVDAEANAENNADADGNGGIAGAADVARRPSRLRQSLHANSNLARQHAPNSSIVGVRRRARTLGVAGAGAPVDLRTLMRQMDDIEFNIMSMLAGR